VPNDLLGDHLGCRQRRGIDKRLVLDVGPDVEIEAIAGGDLLVAPALEPLRLLAGAGWLARLVGDPFPELNPGLEQEPFDK